MKARRKLENIKFHKCPIGEPHPIFYNTKITFCLECWENCFRNIISPPSSPVTSPRKIIE